MAVCRQRQLDAIVVGLPQHVYYFSAHLPFWLHHPAFVLFADGRSCLINANQHACNVAADEVRSYQANWMGTQRQEQPQEVAAVVLGLLAERHAKRVGLDASLPSSQLALALPSQCLSIDADLWQMRRRKDPDELAMMRQAIGCCVAMYDQARQIMRPGLDEIHLFGQLHAAAVAQAGEPLTALLGNDYACGVGGGPPKGRRLAQEGQIYILDLGPCYRGYFADNCRALAVNGKPTAAQFAAWRTITGVFGIIEKLARPGVKCRDLFQAVNDYYRQTSGRDLPHHLGHGVGLQPHEFPHLNPRWDDTLLEGEVFTAEPGLYADELAGGIRIENNYLVTSTGVESLLDYPMELV
jgi:Xaa-Pro aminopeptidase